FNIGNFEDYYVMHSRLLAAMEKRFGTESKRLIPVLVMLERFLILTDRAPEANEVVKRISTITGNVYGTSAPEDIVMLRLIGKTEKRKTRVVQRTTFPDSRITVPDPLTPARVGGVVGRPGVSMIYYPTRTISQINGTTITTTSTARSVIVSIVVDESGSVIDANAQVTNEKVKKRVERKVKAWKFRPLIIDGVGRRMIGEVLVNS
ncbi:MAG TPA: hypothetical protein PKO33_11805, partial [Pyrinomonadaceae bacterium]|nr:hypothetical protein [Pyrinomonadaceae bacterium]